MKVLKSVKYFSNTHASFVSLVILISCQTDVVMFHDGHEDLLDLFVFVNDTPDVSSQGSKRIVQHILSLGDLIQTDLKNNNESLERRLATLWHRLRLV